MSVWEQIAAGFDTFVIIRFFHVKGQKERDDISLVQFIY